MSRLICLQGSSSSKPHLCLWLRLATHSRRGPKCSCLAWVPGTRQPRRRFPFHCRSSWEGRILSSPKGARGASATWRNPTADELQSEAVQACATPPVGRRFGIGVGQGHHPRGCVCFCLQRACALGAKGCVAPSRDVTVGGSDDGRTYISNSHACASEVQVGPLLGGTVLCSLSHSVTPPKAAEKGGTQCSHTGVTQDLQGVHVTVQPVPPL